MQAYVYSTQIYTLSKSYLTQKVYVFVSATPWTLSPSYTVVTLFIYPALVSIIYDVLHGDVTCVYLSIKLFDKNSLGFIINWIF